MCQCLDRDILVTVEIQDGKEVILPYHPKFCPECGERQED